MVTGLTYNLIHIYLFPVNSFSKSLGREKNDPSLNINNKYHLQLFFEELKLIFSFWMRDDLAWVSTQWLQSQIMLQNLLWRKQNVAVAEIFFKHLTKLKPQKHTTFWETEIVLEEFLLWIQQSSSSLFVLTVRKVRKP